MPPKNQPQGLFQWDKDSRRGGERAGAGARPSTEVYWVIDDCVRAS